MYRVWSRTWRQKERIDFYCWDLYARVSQWYTADANEVAERKQLRLETLHAIEHGGNEIAEVADLIATAVLRRHLETMERLSIEYDFLPRESEILASALLGRSSAAHRSIGEFSTSRPKGRTKAAG